VKLQKFLKQYAIVQLSENSDYGRCIWALNNALKAVKKISKEKSQSAQAAQSAAEGKEDNKQANENIDISHSLEIVKKYTNFTNKLNEANELLDSTRDTSIISKYHTAAFLVNYYDKNNDLEKSRYFSEMIPKDLVNRYLGNSLLNKLGLGANVPRPGTAAYVIEDLFS